MSEYNKIEKLGICIYLYYGYNGGICVSQTNKLLSINLKDYLLVSGWYNMCLIFIMSCINYCCNLKFLRLTNYKTYILRSVI